MWIDANHDAKTDFGELKTLAELNITQINLTAQSQSGLVRDGNEILSSGTFIQSGLTKEAPALNFLASGTGTTVSTQGGVSSYVASNAAGESIDVATKGVNNAYGAQGNDILTGNGGDNWLVGAGGSDTFNAGAGNDVLLIEGKRSINPNLV